MPIAGEDATHFEDIGLRQHHLRSDGSEISFYQFQRRSKLMTGGALAVM